MFGEKPLADVIRFFRAFLTNQIARWMPRRYVEWTEQTGRGADEESAEEIANYFRTCFDEYFRRLDIADREITAFLSNRRVMEYGPGDLPGVALLMYAYGADKVYCVDRFPLLNWSRKNVAVMQGLIDHLPAEFRQRARDAFCRSGDPTSGLKPDCIEYLVRSSGLSGLRNEVVLVYSRAVLEHVDDLFATFTDMDNALTSGGIAIHKVDLRSHGLHQRNPLDFLTWPQALWRLMFSHKGVPNRWRVDRYRAALVTTSLELEHLEPTMQVGPEVIREVRAHLARPFQTITDEELSWLGFWLIARKKEF
jgi:hypothetical protein